ncbi:MAG: HD domain-containing protein [Candidatus Aegiribacteria sp.]
MDELFQLFMENGHQLYLVGGCVRDSLLGRDTRDWDLATDARPEVSLELLREAGYSAYPVGMDFGTVGAVVLTASGPADVQITTYRCSESYHKGSRHPEVAFGTSLEEDLLRRDFTVNAMAMDRRGKVIDPLGGRLDLKDRLLRTPLDPGETFCEDPLRMLRAFRFACTLGFSIGKATLDAISSNHSRIMDISRERWKMEMDLLLTAPDPKEVSRVLGLMRDSGLLSDLIPHFEEVFRLDRFPQGKAHRGDLWEHTLDAMAMAPSDDACLRWALLLHDIGKPSARTAGKDGEFHFHGHENRGGEIAAEVAGRFRFSKKERACLVFLVKNHMRPVLYSGEWSQRAVRKLARDAGEHLERLLDLARADMASHAEPFASRGLENLEELRERLRSRAADVHRRVLPKELGNILIRRVGSDISRAPQVGLILSNLRELVHQGVLQEMAPPEVYLKYLEDHPEIMRKEC